MNEDKNKKVKKRINKMSDKQRKEFDALLIQYITEMNNGLKSMVESNVKKNKLISITLLLFAIALLIISVNIFILQLK